ncbi:MAG: hypothetical protein ACXWPM_01825 [Bdellovibrionota bacterium]
MDELQPVVLKGEQDNDLPVRLTDENGDPIKLTIGAGLLEITAEFPKPVGVLSLTKTAGAVTIVDGEAGRILIRITKENMVLVNVLKSKPQSFRVMVDRTVNAAPDRKVALFPNRIILQPPII